MKKSILIILVLFAFTGCSSPVKRVANTIKKIAWEVAVAKIKTEYPMIGAGLELLNEGEATYIAQYPTTDGEKEQLVLAVINKFTLEVISEMIIEEDGEEVDGE